MSEPDLLVVEFCRDGGEIRKELVVHARMYGESSPTAGERAVMTAMALLADAKTLRPGDRLTVRLPIEGEDILSDDSDESDA
jgi:hypothetical protein